MARVVSAMVVGTLATAIWFGSSPRAVTEPVFDGSATLQVPGVVVGLPLTRGAAPFYTTVEHGHGHIHPLPEGYGYVYQWANLSTGASGTVTDASPDRASVPTGPGLVVVSATIHLQGLYDVITTPAAGAFVVSA